MTTATGPAPATAPQPPADPLLALAALQAAAVLRLELQAAHTASWPLTVALRHIADTGRARWQQAAASGDQAGVDRARGWIAAELRAAAGTYLRPADVRSVLEQAGTQATALGHAHADAQIALQRPHSPATTAHRLPGAVPGLTPASSSPPLLRPVADGARDTATARIADAVRGLTTARTPRDLDTALAGALRAPDDLSLAAAWLVNHAANVPARDAAIRVGAHLLWIAEPDACVVCTALSGHTADVMAGDGFDEFATFGPHRPPAPWPPGRGLTGPPRHPHCRCQTVVYFGVRAGQPDLAVALRREAVRSILRGWSRPSETHRTRIVAAERLLRSGHAAGAPKSVRAYAASAVAAGRFPTRDVPARHAHQPRRAP